MVRNFLNCRSAKNRYNLEKTFRNNYVILYLYTSLMTGNKKKKSKENKKFNLKVLTSGIGG